MAGIFLAIYALLLWVLLFFVWRKGYDEWKVNRANRVQELQARVLDKRENVVTEDPQAGRVTEFLVLFEFGSRQREYKVDSSLYTATRVGQEGTVRLRGGRFESFEAKSESERAEDLYRRLMKD